MTKQKPAIETEAQKLVAKLAKWGMKDEEIAFKARVSVNSVIRWHRGVRPHPGHLADLRDLVAAEQKKRKKSA